MSELKEHLFCECDECIREYRGPLSNEMRPYYLKSEADKVIAEKDKEIDKLKESIGKLLKSKTEQIMDEVLEKVIIYGEGFVPIEHAMKLVAELRHYKYKRCLAMAKWCESEAYIHEHGSDYDEDLVAWFGKWHKRWMELADKFKEAE